MRNAMRGGARRNHIRPQKFFLAPPAPSPLFSFSPQTVRRQKTILSPNPSRFCSPAIIWWMIGPISPRLTVEGKRKWVEGVRGRRAKPLGPLWVSPSSPALHLHLNPAPNCTRIPRALDRQGLGATVIVEIFPFLNYDANPLYILPHMPTHAILSPVILITLIGTGCAIERPGESQRKDTVLTTGWRFIRKDVPSAQSRDFNDADWQTVTLPHTWNALDGQDGGDNYYRGPGWYRLPLGLSTSIPWIWTKNSLPPLRSRLACGGCLRQRPASPGGILVGSRRFVLTSRRSSTPAITLLAVRVDNAPSPDIPPVSGDFTICGGLYRDRPSPCLKQSPHLPHRRRLPRRLSQASGNRRQAGRD